MQLENDGNKRKAMPPMLLYRRGLRRDLDSLPIKIFEYMAAGLAVLSSHFPLWKNIIEKSQCGLCVDPLNRIEIEQGIRRILRNPRVSHIMGECGRAVLRQLYSWEAEAEQLIGVYRRVLN